MFRLISRKSLILLGISAVLTVAIGCSSSPEPTATPIPPTATPIPTATPTPTPVPVAPIEVDWDADPVGFLNSLPAGEASCAADALGGRDRVLAVLESNSGDDKLTESEAAALDGCLSDETVRAVFIGQLSREAGTLSDATIICIGEQIGGMSAAGLFLDEPAADVIISSLKGVFCLSHEEREAISASEAFFGFGELGGIDAIECVVNGVGPTGLEDLLGVFSADSIDFALIGDQFPLLIDCGAINDALFEDTGLTADQFGCVLSSLGEDGLALLDPTAAEPDFSEIGAVLIALGDCGIEIADLLESSELPLDPDAMTDPAGSLIDPTVIPTVQIESPEDVADLDLPFTPEQIICLTAELGEDEIANLLAGGAPDLSLFAALGTCEVDIGALLGG